MIWLLVLFLVAELFYFKIADKFGIIDKPNQRSSHSYITRRGGGIIFPFAWLAYCIYNGFNFPLLTLGLLIISVVSFFDDLSEVGVKKRISLHLLSLALAFYDLGVFNMLPWWGSAICMVVSLAALNAVNFMDGINGITGLYALCFWMSVALFGSQIVSGNIWALSSPVPYLISAILVFGFFNFRKKAVCFAGDVGSVSMAYLMISITAFLVFSPDGILLNEASQLKTGEIAPTFSLKYLLLLSVYGIDSFLTIVHRIILKENIFKGHRKHLYQLLVNEFKYSHLPVALSYALIQLGINIWVLNTDINFIEGATLLTVLAATYVVMKTYILSQTAVEHSHSSPEILPNITFDSIELIAKAEELEDVVPPITKSRQVAFEQELHHEQEVLSR